VNKSWSSVVIYPEFVDAGLIFEEDLFNLINDGLLNDMRRKDAETCD
jgi:hypothetical protein